MNQLWQQGIVRDYWSRWSPAVIENMSWLNSPDCFRPKVFVGPIESRMDVAANGYLVEVFLMVPGSWIVGLLNSNADTLDFQITDTGANYKFFSAPAPAGLISNKGGYAQPFWLPEPYMMAGPAALRLEVWNNTAAATDNSQLGIMVLEPREV